MPEIHFSSLPAGRSTSPKLILASASPRRRELLAALGVEFRVVAPEGVDEAAARGAAREVARSLAIAKAEAVLRSLRHPGGGAAGTDWIVLGSDTVVAVGDAGEEELLGKPEGEDDARRMLRLLSGRSHSVWTGVAVARDGSPTRVEAERSEVTFRALGKQEIEAYVRSGEPAGKAGAYAIQGAGGGLVSGFRGCYYNIVGLPLARVSRLLAAVTGEYRCDCGAHPLQQGEGGCRQG